MGNRKKRAPGPQQHAEGQHGEKTHRRFIEQLHERASRASAEPSPDGDGDTHRSDETREQHDDAERNSERKNANTRQ